MIKLLGLDAVFDAAGTVYWLLMLGLTALVLIKASTWKRKLGFSVLVLALFHAPLVPAIYETIQYRSKLSKAQALFDERCKTAGEKIYRTVEGVEGIGIYQLRPTAINFSNQYQMDDPYGRQNGGGDNYALEFLQSMNSDFHPSQYRSVPPYRFVDVFQDDGASVRYKINSGIDPRKVGSYAIEKQSTSTPTRYGLRWQDTSTNEDRKNWIACGSVEVVDSKTNQILGIRQGCMFDVALGSTGGGRSPWAFARNQSCPEPGRTKDGHAKHEPVDHYFATRVLTPKQGDK